MATLQDVANLAGVSASTVSRVLNNHPYVTEETSARVVAAMKKLNYSPSRVAQQLRTHTSQIIGLILSDISNPFFTSVIRGIQDVAYRNGFSLIVCNSDEDPERERAYVEILLAERVAGVIIAPALDASPAYGPLFEAGVPVVCVDRPLDGYDADTALVDNVKGASEATSHLIGLGHTRIGLISGPLTITTGLRRQEGYVKALAEHNLPVDPGLMVEGDFDYDSGHRGALALLQLEDPPTALFVGNNLMTLGALNAVHAIGLRIPDDIAVVGFDDMPWAPSLNPPLTAVSQPTYELGERSAELLLQRVRERSLPVRQIVLEPVLVVRDSCGAGKAGCEEKEVRSTEQLNSVPVQ
jgi:LacI family transcriptional regulator